VGIGLVGSKTYFELLGMTARIFRKSLGWKLSRRSGSEGDV
jgi:hypothetical protein